MDDKMFKIVLYTQYMRNDFLVSLFDWESRNIERFTEWAIDLELYSYLHLNGKLLQLYVAFAYGLPSPPITTPETIDYDKGFLYDSDARYDEIDDPLYIDDDLFKRYIFFQVRQDLRENNIYNLYKRIKDFLDIPYEDITIDEPYPNIFTCTVPNSPVALFLQKLVYAKRITIGYGVDFEVILQ